MNYFNFFSFAKLFVEPQNKNEESAWFVNKD